MVSFVSWPLLWISRKTRDYCVASGLVDEQDQERLLQVDDSPKNVKFSFWFYAVVAAVGFTLPSALIAPAVAYILLLALPFGSFALFLFCAATFDKAVSKSIRMFEIDDSMQFLFGMTAPGRNSMRDRRLKLLSILRKMCLFLDRHSEDCALTSDERETLWRKYLQSDNIRGLIGASAEPDEKFFDAKSLKSLWKILFLTRSQLITFLIKRLYVCSCDSVRSDYATFPSCLCRSSCLKMLRNLFVVYYLVLTATVQVAVMFRKASGTVPTGCETRKRETKAPRTEDCELLKAIVLLNHCLSELGDVKCLSSVREETTKKLQEVLSILRSSTTKPNPIAPIEQAQNRDIAIRTTDVNPAAIVAQEQEKQVPDYQVFEGVQTEFEANSTTDYYFDEEEFSRKSRNCDRSLMNELKGALASQAQVHFEREQTARRMAGFEELADPEEIVFSSEDSRHRAVICADSINEDFRPNPNVIDEILASLPKRESAQEEKFGDSDDD